ncbi:hypothetical protein [Opitutus sp. ER46]|uniref:hypothetical protein n=1 Tax=Opitutus sp. ER46 TaxID=2161864 RepID=UPI0013049F5F|nr:hypothetical protein [Opitutus sp. ER46]
MMLTLLEAQKVLLTNSDPKANTPVIEALRAKVPAPVLAHFLRLVAQHRKGVAEVRNGVCSQCHIRLPASMAAVMVKSDDIHVCEQCGSFLVLADLPSAQPTPAPTAPKTPRARKYSRQLAA